MRTADSRYYEVKCYQLFVCFIRDFLLRCVFSRKFNVLRFSVIDLVTTQLQDIQIIMTIIPIKLFFGCNNIINTDMNDKCMSGA